MLKIFLTVVFLTGSILLATAYYYLRSADTTNTQTYTETQSLVQEGAQDASHTSLPFSHQVRLDNSAYYLEQADKTPDADQQLSYKVAAAVASLNKKTPEDVQQAITLFEEIYNNPQTSARRKSQVLLNVAVAVDRLGWDMQYEPSIYTGSFAQFKGTDIRESIRNVYKHSFEIYQEPRALISLAYHDAYTLRTNPKQAAVQGVTTTSIENRIKEAERLAAELPRFNQGNIEGENAWYLYWRAVTYGLLSQVSQKYDTAAASAYGDVFGLLDPYATRYDTSVTDTVPFTHYQYALYLDARYGKDRYNDTARVVDLLTSHITNDPRKEKAMFARMLAVQAKQCGKPCTATVAKLAPYSIDFRTLLEGKGFTGLAK